MVWEVKAIACWIPRGDGVVGPYWLIVACSVLNPAEQKFFLSNAASGVPLSVLVHVAFSRWPVERCLQTEKTELGLSHFEVRGYPALQRHLLITQVSHLFLARETQRLRGEKSRDDFAASASRDQRPDRELASATCRPQQWLGAHRQDHHSLATSESTSAHQPHQNPTQRTANRRHQRRKTSTLPTGLKP